MTAFGASPVAATALSRSSIKLVFLTHAFASGSLFTRIPDLQQGLGLDAAMLGLAFLGQPIGALGTFLVASRIVEHTGTRLVLLAGISIMTLALVAMALAPSASALAAAIVVHAALFALTNVAMNVEADRVEAATDKRLMNTCHGIWSLGQLAAFLLGALLRGLEVPPLVHFGALLPVIVLVTLLVVLPMREAAARGHGATDRRRLALPTTATLKLLGFMVGGAMVEAATRTWSVIYSRDSFDAPDWADAMTLPVFVAFVAAGRFFADGLTHRFGPARLARALMLVALAGAAIVVVAPSLPVSLIGFALMGIGICTSFPASTSAAAQLGDRPASANVAALTMSVQTVLLGVPPLMGLIADTVGIRGTFALVLPVLVLAFVLARALEPKPAG